MGQLVVKPHALHAILLYSIRGIQGLLMKQTVIKLILLLSGSAVLVSIVIFAINKEKERRFYAAYKEQQQTLRSLPACAGDALYQRRWLLRTIENLGYKGKPIYCRIKEAKVIKNALIGPAHRFAVFRILSINPVILQYDWERGVQFGGGNDKPVLHLPGMTLPLCNEGGLGCIENRDKYKAIYKNVPIAPPLTRLVVEADSKALSSCRALIKNNDYDKEVPGSLSMVTNDAKYQSSFSIPINFGQTLEHEGKYEGTALCKADVYIKK